MFRRDRLAGTTERVSVSSNGSPANHVSEFVEISGDGRFVAFQSIASNLAPGVTNGVRHIFVRDRTNQQTFCASVNNQGEFANGDCDNAVLSLDGHFVAFESFASNLAPLDTNNYADVFVYDTQSHQTELISATPSRTSGNGASGGASISDDGRFVVFSSSADDLVPGQSADASGIFLFDRGTRTLTPLEKLAKLPGTLAGIFAPVISPDARWLAFSAFQTDSISGNHFSDVYLCDLASGTVRRVSQTREGQPSNDYSQGTRFSADGRFFVFKSWASSLAGEETFGVSQVLFGDQASFQPDASIRGNDASSARGAGSFSIQDETIEQVASTIKPLILHALVQNTGTYADSFIITSAQNVADSVQVQYLDNRTSQDITMAVTGAGWNTGDLAVGATRDIQLVVRPSGTNELPQNVFVLATSLNDPSKSDRVLASVSLDLDGDGMPDAWERQFFGSPANANATSDHDGDGVSDLLEFLAGTNPNDPRSAFKLTRIEMSSTGQVTLSWQSEASRFYTIERATALEDKFTPIATHLSATPPSNVFTDSSAVGEQARFYRILIE